MVVGRGAEGKMTGKPDSGARDCLSTLAATDRLDAVPYVAARWRAPSAGPFWSPATARLPEDGVDLGPTGSRSLRRFLAGAHHVHRLLLHRSHRRLHEF